MITSMGYWYFIKGKWVALRFYDYQTWITTSTNYTYGIR